MFGWSLLASLMGRSSFRLGLQQGRARIAFADLKGTAYGGSAFSSHLPRTPSRRTSENSTSRTFVNEGKEGEGRVLPLSGPALPYGSRTSRLFARDRVVCS